MKIIRNTMTIADLNNYYRDGDLVINKDYQREKGLWPSNARSYFIDTILNGFPFPKITLRQKIDLKTKKSIREIIDGQQRFHTIIDFINDKLRLSKASKNYAIYVFSDLDEETQSDFLSYEVSVDTAVGSTDDDVVNIFRRINSYTLPLNKQERRHASFQGEFKWFIKDIIDQYTPLLDNYKILTKREISRMYDADLFTELCQVILDDGVVTRSNPKLDNIYKTYDKDFSIRNDLETKLTSTLDFIKTEFQDILDTELLSGFTFYSFFSALVYNKWGIANINEEDVVNKPVTNKYCNNKNIAIEKIIELLNDLDIKNDQGSNADFVRAGLRTTHSISNRKIRIKYFITALQM